MNELALIIIRFRGRDVELFNQCGPFVIALTGAIVPGISPDCDPVNKIQSVLSELDQSELDELAGKISESNPTFILAGGGKPIARPIRQN